MRHLGLLTAGNVSQDGTSRTSINHVWRRRMLHRCWWILNVKRRSPERVGEAKSHWKYSRLPIYTKPFRILLGVWQGCTLSPILSNYNINKIFSQGPPNYPGVQTRYNVHMPNLNYTHDVMFLSSNYMEMQNLPEAVNRHASAVGMCNNASKISTYLRNSIWCWALWKCWKIQIPRLNVRRKRSFQWRDHTSSLLLVYRLSSSKEGFAGL